MSEDRLSVPRAFRQVSYLIAHENFRKTQIIVLYQEHCAKTQLTLVRSLTKTPMNKAGTPTSTQAVTLKRLILQKSIVLNPILNSSGKILLRNCSPENGKVRRKAMQDSLLNSRITLSLQAPTRSCIQRRSKNC